MPYAGQKPAQPSGPHALEIATQHSASQTGELTQKLDQRPQSDMRERSVTIPAHRDRQNSESCSHRKILLPIRLFATARRLMMNASRRRYIQHLPLTTKTVTEIQILAWRAARKERCETTNRLKCVTAQRTCSTSDPFALYRTLGRFRITIWKCRAN